MVWEVKTYYFISLHSEEEMKRKIDEEDLKFRQMLEKKKNEKVENEKKLQQQEEEQRRRDEGSIQSIIIYSLFFAFSNKSL